MRLESQQSMLPNLKELLLHLYVGYFCPHCSPSLRVHLCLNRVRGKFTWLQKKILNVAFPAYLVRKPLPENLEDLMCRNS